jgi:uncharacterized metal-binding protein YceD (DUF177 family)
MTCRIEIKGLSKGEHNFEFKLDGSFFEAYENDTIADADLDVVAIVNKGDGRMGLVLQIDGDVTVRCDRCLADLVLPVAIESPFSVLFSSYVDEDDEQVGEDVIVVDRNQGELDISQLIYDYVYLHLPLKKVHPDGECDPEMMEKMKDILK